MEQYITFYDLKGNLILNTFKDFHVLIQELTIPSAVVKEEIEEIPGTSDILDYTESNGDVHYERRVIPIELAGIKNRDEFLSIHSKFQNLLHGKNVKMIFSEEPNFYWIGRVSVGDINPYGVLRSINLEVKVDPYKYEIISSADDWLWDPFSFVDGIINECKDLVVNGALDVTIQGRRKHVIPKIISDSEMTVTFNDVTYNLSAGINEVLDIEILEGQNLLTFKGNGTVSVDYRGGSL
ncbi:MAG: mtfA protein [Clostridia bacterium]|nr:mtfA protein [Clostridia bacterium]